MTLHIAHHTLVEDVARIVESVPGVAFLKPGLATRLRSAWSRTGTAPGTAPGAGGPPAAGVRLTPGADDTAGWHVDVQVVASRRIRTVDVARAVRTAVQGHLAALFPGRPGARVTVTGLL
ncbi:hypothetical protein ACWDFL_37945 [Streptomyces bungoensis]